MKITILGNCATQTINHETTSFLINDDNTNLLIDCGPGITGQLLKMKFNPLDLSGIIITHVHGDHIAGLPYLLFLISVNLFNSSEPKQYSIDLFATKTVIETAKILVEMQYPVENLWNKYVKPHFIQTDDNNTLEINNLSLTFFDVNHVVPTIGFSIIDSQNKKITYSCDTRPSENVIRNGKNSDIFIHEAFCLDNMNKMAYINGHSTAKQAGEVANKANAKKLYLCHPLAFLLDKKQSLIDEVNLTFNGEVYIPSEFEVIRI